MDISPLSFPEGAQDGLVVLDKTLSKEESSVALKKYIAYFENEGFTFQPLKRIKNVEAYVGEQFMRKKGFDYLIRDGHADGDDDNIIVIYQDGLLYRGVKITDKTTESISIVFNLAAKAKEQRIDNDQFASWIDQSYREKGKPFVLLNTSCWGIEKAFVSLAHETSSRLIEIASPTVINVFAYPEADATGVLINGIRHGESFEAMRVKLKSFRDGSNGREDVFILPDESGYPQMTPIIRMHRALFIRKGKGKARRYTPNGYL